MSFLEEIKKLSKLNNIPTKQALSRFFKSRNRNYNLFSVNLNNLNHLQEALLRILGIDCPSPFIGYSDLELYLTDCISNYTAINHDLIKSTLAFLLFLSKDTLDYPSLSPYSQNLLDAISLLYQTDFFKILPESTFHLKNQIDTNLYHQDSSLIHSLLPTNSFKQANTRSLFGALSHPSIKTQVNMPWNITDIVLSVPDLEEACDFSLDYVNKDEDKTIVFDSTKVFNSKVDVTSDSGYSSDSEIPRDSSTFITRLNSWECHLGIVNRISYLVSNKKNPQVTRLKPKEFNKVYVDYMSDIYEQEFPIDPATDITDCIFYMFYGIESDLFKWNQETSEFFIVGEYLRVYSCGYTSFNSILLRFIEFSTNLKRLQLLVDEINSNKSYNSI